MSGWECPNGTDGCDGWSPDGSHCAWCAARGKPAWLGNGIESLQYVRRRANTDLRASIGELNDSDRQLALARDLYERAYSLPSTANHEANKHIFEAMLSLERAGRVLTEE